MSDGGAGDISVDGYSVNGFSADGFSVDGRAVVGGSANDPPTAVEAMMAVLVGELLPALRSTVLQLGGDDDGSLARVAPTPRGNAYPSNSAAAVVYHLCGVLTSWGAACLGGEDVERDRPSEFEYTGPVLPELDRLDALVARLPEWWSAARARGSLCHPTGTEFDVAAARAAGTLTPTWVLAHILHDVACHLGHLEVTRDVLLHARQS